MDGWPTVVTSWVAMIRKKLNIEDGEPVYDNHAAPRNARTRKMTFHEITMFNHWMQRQFRAAKQRGIRLMPIVGVKRMHVRLDPKTLCLMFKNLFPKDERVVELKRLEKLHRDSSDPKCLLPAPPKRPVKGSDAETRAQYRAARAAHDLEVARIMETPEYIEQDQRYGAWKAVQGTVASAFFGSIPRRPGWTFSGSVVTDGVAVSLQYHREVQREVGAPKPKKKKTKKAPTSVDALEETTDDYDRNLATVTDDLVVLGIDPGRVSLATVAVLYLEGNKLVRKTWSLSRGEYRETSGIRRVERDKAARFAHLQRSFQTLAASPLSAIDGWEIREYMRRYSAFADEWWRAALRRVESRENLVGFMV
jgi:hypothetical protein